MANKEQNGFNEISLDEVHNQAAHKSFLGREFLTWLWFFSEQKEGHFELSLDDSTSRKAQIWIEDRVVLTAKTGSSHEHIIKGGVPSVSAEAGISLRSGKSVKELRVGFEIEGIGSFAATLSGDLPAPKNIHLPELPEQTDLSPVECRIEMISAAHRAIDALFAKFMSERTDKRWESEHVNSIRSWIQTRQHDTSTIH